jgi:hypothetical protein
MLRISTGASGSGLAWQFLPSHIIYIVSIDGFLAQRYMLPSVSSYYNGSQNTAGKSSRWAAWKENKRRFLVFTWFVLFVTLWVRLSIVVKDGGKECFLYSRSSSWQGRGAIVSKQASKSVSHHHHHHRILFGRTNIEFLFFLALGTYF